MTALLPPGRLALLGPGRPPPPVPEPAGQHYWDAAPFAALLLDEFRAARRAGDTTAIRERFYVLASYFRRTLAILHFAFRQRNEPLAASALRNLTALQRALSEMREVAPHTSMSTFALEPDIHRRVNRDLVYRILVQAGGPLHAATVARRFNELNVIGDARAPAVAHALLTLTQTGHVIERDGRYQPSGVPYVDSNVDRAGLAVLLGPRLLERFEEAGIDGLEIALERRPAFIEAFRDATGFGQETAELACPFLEALAQPADDVRRLHGWDHPPLLDSARPRPYQRMLHSVLRTHGYAGQVVEAPAGSGKTFVGMLCIEDWLRTLAPGQSILVLVPTVNYQQQWLGELCLERSGLQLAPDLVSTGTPLERTARSGARATPPVSVLTYSALAQMASGRGRCGFDGDAIERFLQAANVRHVILDEVHKVAADLDSPTAEMTRLLVRWLRDGSIASLIGFSGTVVAVERQLAALGLRLASVLSDAELIAQGWVAPFAEFGMPFSYSERERAIVDLIHEYRAAVAACTKQFGAAQLRQHFAEIPLEVRVRIARALGMYDGRPNAAELIGNRMRRWESGGEVGLGELLLVSIVQIANNWPDRALLARCGREDADSWLTRFAALRERLRAALPPGLTRERLSVDGFGVSLDVGPFGGEDGRQQRLAARDALATTFAGAYLAIREWTRSAGEGRVAIVQAILAAERRTRVLSGVIVFETPSPLRPHDGVASPGYRGAGGLFAELLRDGGCVPIAALRSALYLPEPAGRSLHEDVADWVVEKAIVREQGEALFALEIAAARLDPEAAAALRPVFDARVREYAGSLARAPATLGEAERVLLRPLRRDIRAVRVPGPRSAESRMHTRAVLGAIVDYAAIARAFRDAQLVEIVTGAGSHHPTRIVLTGGRHRRQRMLDLTARMVDTEDLPFDLIVVSSWARTGWNVVSPNVLIDATATRDVTAWKQLRGRAMRPRPTWTAAAQGQIERLLAGETAEDPSPLDRAVDVMLEHNKVTHIYELVSAKGSQPQVMPAPGQGAWERIPAIAAKHRHEHAVRAHDGMLMDGCAHAPLIVDVDPRVDHVDGVERRLEEELRHADARIVRGWLEPHGAPGPKTVELSSSPNAD